MIIGIRRRQWPLLFLALAVPILLNGAGIWKDIGTNAVLQILLGTYSPYPYKSFGVMYNPMPEILLNLLLMTIPLGFLAWVMLFIFNKTFFQKQPLVLRVIETVLTAPLFAVVFAMITGFFMPLAWLPKFHDLLGLPGSPFMMEWSGWLVLPITTIILAVAVFLEPISRLAMRLLCSRKNALSQ
jgi:hypothetical protein